MEKRGPLSRYAKRCEFYKPMILAIFAYQNSSKRGRVVFSGERDEGKGEATMSLFDETICKECTWRSNTLSCSSHDAQDTCPGFSNMACGSCHESPCKCHNIAEAGDGDSMSDEYVWLAGWYATRLHAVKATELERLKKARLTSFESECGAWVGDEPLSEWAKKKLAAGVPHCKRCERKIKNTPTSNP